jgi:four helix bundle protein
MAGAYQDLVVWQRAVELSVAIYGLTASFPREEIYGLTSQLRRASVSIASNIAEGWGRQSDSGYKHFLAMSRGSLFELQTQLVIARKLRFGEATPHAEVDRLATEISKMLVALMKSIGQPAKLIPNS